MKAKDSKILNGMLLLALSGFSAVASATDTLISELGGQVVYDQTTNLSWIANANLAATNTFGVNGINPGGYMTWNTAQNWIAAMDAANYMGNSDWRLPTSDTCSGLNCTGSELGNLFYNGLGQAALRDIGTVHNANYSLFKNVQDINLWSGTEWAPSPTYAAWEFNTYAGSQNVLNKGVSTYMFALAVSTGNVAAVPEPESYAMMLAGLGLMGFMVRRKQSA
jgi:hypothetical protein